MKSWPLEAKIILPFFVKMEYEKSRYYFLAIQLSMKKKHICNKKKETLHEKIKD